MSESYDNNGQYSRHSILRYEKIFGKGFVSTGGLPIVERFCDALDLPAEAQIMDIGSGLGGAAFYIADRFKAKVLGVDLSEMMLTIASERAEKNNQSYVTFEWGNILELDLPEGHFDLIWSRDALLHIPQKEELFQKIHKWLKPGGQVMISDYSQSKEPQSEVFQAYVKKSGYHLLDVGSYGNLLKQAEFVDVVTEDWTSLFIEILHEEMKMLETQRETFLEDFSQEDLDYLMERWKKKIGYCQKGDMRVGMWKGFKRA